MGHKACEVFDSGITVSEYVAYFVKEYANDPDMSTFAAYVGGAAIAVYCPEYRGQVNAL